MGSARSAVEKVVSHHEGLRVALGDRLLERHQEVLPEVALIHDRLAACPVQLVVVGDEVLEGRGHLDVLGVVALQTLDDGNRQGAVEEGILAIHSSLRPRRGSRPKSTMGARIARPTRFPPVFML